MVNTKSHSAGCEVWKIGDDRDHFVPAWAPENQVMRRVMNDHVISMVGEGTDAESQKQTEPPIAKSQLAHAVPDRRLESHDGHRDQRGPRISRHQPADFRMRLNERPRAPRMWLIRFRLVKRRLHQF